MMDPRNLNVFTAGTVLSMMVNAESAGGGGSPEVHNHLHCFERVELQVV